jgi:hypothetical protein
LTYVSIDDQGHPQVIKRADAADFGLGHDDYACMGSWFETLRRRRAPLA